MKPWVEKEFASADLGDKRLNKRLKLIVSGLFNSPSESVKAALRGWKDVIGAYRFFNNKKVSIASILQPHREATLERIKQHQRALLIQDTSELDYTPKTKLKGKGPLGTVYRTGFFSHNHFIVTPEGIPLGIWDTKIYARDEAEHGKSKSRKYKPIEEKESHRWLEGYRQACNLADLVKDTEIISCSDREGDIYEVFEEWHQRMKKGEPIAEILIRSCYDRNIVHGSQENERKIIAKLSAAPLLGSVDIYVKKKIQSKIGKNRSRKKTIRSARTAILEIRAVDVMLSPPHRSDRKLSEVAIHVVMAKEKLPPEGEDPICWVLLTSLKADNFESNLEIVRLYAERWEIECFHRVLKTGCKVEELQIKDDKRVLHAIAIYMVVAWRVMYVMKLGRECPDLPCNVIFEEDEWKSLYVIAHGREALKEIPSLGEFVNTVASFGGYLGRKCDGPPGAQSIWLGMRRVVDFALAWNKFREHKLLSEP